MLVSDAEGQRTYEEALLVGDPLDVIYVRFLHGENTRRDLSTSDAERVALSKTRGTHLAVVLSTEEDGGRNPSAATRLKDRHHATALCKKLV
jgi:hypothetical protein